MNIWSLPLKLLSIGLSTALGSLQMAEPSRIHNSENWVGDRVRSTLETPYSTFLILQFMKKKPERISDLTKIIQLDHGTVRLKPGSSYSFENDTF